MIAIPFLCFIQCSVVPTSFNECMDENQTWQGVHRQTSILCTVLWVQTNMTNFTWECSWHSKVLAWLNPTSCFCLQKQLHKFPSTTSVCERRIQKCRSVLLENFTFSWWDRQNCHAHSWRLVWIWDSFTGQAMTPNAWPRGHVWAGQYPHLQSSHGNHSPIICKGSSWL